MSSLYILWDESFIWGLLAWRAIASMGFSCRVVRAREIAGGLLQRNPGSVLVVPGGVARRKAEKLGQAGMEAIRTHIGQGGAYVGFCGGSGLGLTGKYGLDLCPWKRAALKDRMLHLISGHVHVKPLAGSPFLPEGLPDLPCVPVWWPARFAQSRTEQVEVLASYDRPGPDFWVADLPLESLPEGTLAEWEADYGVNLQPSKLAGQPCIVRGSYGRGTYLLSYAHLETPNSPEANLWLAHILRTLLHNGEGKDAGTVPAWELETQKVRWHAPELARARTMLDEVLRLGREHFLLFKRNCWLWGWRAGIPGSSLNHLYSLLCQVQSMDPSPVAEDFLRTNAIGFTRALERFGEEAKGYLLAERLAMTLAKSFPETVSADKLKLRREELFGHAMEQGGLFAELLDVLDELCWLLISRPKGLFGGTSLF